MRHCKYAMGTWQRKLYKVCFELCLNTDAVEAAIDTITSRYSDRSARYCYDRCYAMIKPLIMAI